MEAVGLWFSEVRERWGHRTCVLGADQWVQLHHLQVPWSVGVLSVTKRRRQKVWLAEACHFPYSYRSSRALWLFLHCHVRRERIIYHSFNEGLQARQPHRVTSGLFTSSNLTQVEYNTKHEHYIYKCKTYKHNLKVSPFSIALIKNGK